MNVVTSAISLILRKYLVEPLTEPDLNAFVVAVVAGGAVFSCNLFYIPLSSITWDHCYLPLFLFYYAYAHYHGNHKERRALEQANAGGAASNAAPQAAFDIGTRRASLTEETPVASSSVRTP